MSCPNCRQEKGRKLVEMCRHCDYRYQARRLWIAGLVILAVAFLAGGLIL